MESNERECPFCAEIIKAKAKVCRFCNRDVEPIVTVQSVDDVQPVADASVSADPVAPEPVVAVAPEPVPVPKEPAAPHVMYTPYTPPPPPVDKSKQPPVKVMWICLFIAWVCILCPIPMSNAGTAAALVIVKIILAAIFNITTIIMAIVCLARSQILHGVFGLIASTVGTTIVYLLGFFVLVGSGMAAYDASMSPRVSSRDVAPPARMAEAPPRVVEPPSQPVRSGSGTGTSRPNTAAPAVSAQPAARETAQSMLEQADMFYKQKKYT